MRLGEGEFYGCGRPGCDRKVDPDDPTTVVAARQIHFTDGSPSIDGPGLLFHPGCWYGDTRDVKRRPWETGPRSALET